MSWRGENVAVDAVTEETARSVDTAAVGARTHHGGALIDICGMIEICNESEWKSEQFSDEITTTYIQSDL